MHKGELANTEADLLLTHIFFFSFFEACRRDFHSRESERNCWKTLLFKNVSSDNG